MTASIKEALESAEKALRFLADHDRPQGGQSDYNAEHLIDIADRAKTVLASLSCGEARERIALQIWHRFADNSTVEWEDETHKDEFLLCADAILATGCVPGEAERAENSTLRMALYDATEGISAACNEASIRAARQLMEEVK